MLQKLAADNQINLRPEGGIAGTVSGFTFASIVSAFLKLILVAASLIFFFILVWGGVQWIMSGGDKGNTEKARNLITNALVGLVIVFSAWAIAQLLGVFFGINIFQLDIPQIGQ